MSTIATAEDSTAFPTLKADQLARLESYGTREDMRAGDVVFSEGEATSGFIVILRGTLAVVGHVDGTEVIIARHTAGRFLGELSLLTGERTRLAARAETDATIVRIDPEAFRHVMAAETELADVIFAALVARREILRSGDGAATLRIYGSRFSARSLELRSFARRQRLPHQWIDLDRSDAGDVDALLARFGAKAADVPFVVTPSAVLLHPTVGELAQHLGLSFRSIDGRLYDVVVVGGGPGGLAAGVYGASEGLDTLVLDSVGPGGQAGTSSRIENFFGFPAGVSGGDLVEQGAMQAIRLGATIRMPCRVDSLELTESGYTLVLHDGAEVHTRAVVIAAGVQYRKLPIDDLERFEGAGVYYAATDLEARLCSADPVVVIGGGNSAGQAAIYLASRGSSVSIVIRGDNLESSMSRYLIERIDASPSIEVLPHTEVVALHGDSHLEAVTLQTKSTSDTQRRRHACTGMFSFIGAVPFTDWLAPHCALDENGFILTDRDLPTAADIVSALPFETSAAGVFAVGDVRHGSMKRVAAAVGEGASAIRSVHEHLARHSH